MVSLNSIISLARDKDDDASKSCHIAAQPALENCRHQITASKPLHEQKKTFEDYFERKNLALGNACKRSDEAQADVDKLSAEGAHAQNMLNDISFRIQQDQVAQPSVLEKVQSLSPYVSALPSYEVANANMLLQNLGPLLHSLESIEKQKQQQSMPIPPNPQLVPQPHLFQFGLQGKPDPTEYPNAKAGMSNFVHAKPPPPLPKSNNQQQ